jgi:hypothetical protein
MIGEQDEMPGENEELRWYHKVVLVGFGLLLTVLLVEIAGRAFHLLPALSDAEYRAVSRRVGTLADPYDHFTNTNYDQGSTEFKVDIHLNKLGFRGGDIPASPPNGARRVLLLGDSYTADWEVDTPDMWSSWLSRWLNQTDQPYDVVDLGFPGFGTDREYLLYEAYGRTLHADLVVLVIYVENDVNDNGIALWTPAQAVAATHPFFTLGADGTLVEHPWNYTDRSRSFEQAPFPDNVIGWLNAHSLTYRLMRDARDRVAASLTGTQEDQGTTLEAVDPDHPTRIPLPLEVLFSQPDARWETAWQITGALLKTLRDSVAADGAQFVVALVPPHMIVQNDYWQFTDLFNASGRAWDLWTAQNRMLALLDDLNIPVINPTQQFIDFRSRTGQLLFYVRDRHFNATGTCVFGTSLANWLMEHGYVSQDVQFPRDPVAECRTG